MQKRTKPNLSEKDENFRRNLKRLRFEKGLSQRQAESMCQLTKGKMTFIECGKVVLKKASKEMICHGLGVTLEDMERPPSPTFPPAPKEEPPVPEPEAVRSPCKKRNLRGCLLMSILAVQLVTLLVVVLA